jgi:transposase
MAYSPKGIMEICEIVARWHRGYPISRISVALGVDRKTVRRYVRAAETAVLSPSKPLPEREALIGLLLPLVPVSRRAQPSRERFEPYREEIKDLVTRSVDPLKPKTAFEVICARHEVQASYSSFKRFMRALAPELSDRGTTCRIEVEPRTEIQVDYGKMGLLFDPDTGRNRVVLSLPARSQTAATR